MAVQEYDVAIVGAGPFGWKAAIYSTEFGQRTAIVERDKFGGICANEGCVPIAARFVDVQQDYEVRSRERWGEKLPYGRFSYEKAKRYGDRLSRQMSGGVRVSLRDNNVDVINGEAHFLNPHQIEVISRNDRQIITAPKFVIATGSRPGLLDIPGSDLPGVINYQGALSLQEPPARVVIIGASRIGEEWAELFRIGGSEVTLMDQADHLIPDHDPDIAEVLREHLTNRGINCLTSAKVFGIRQTTEGLTIDYKSSGSEHQVSADVVLQVARRRPNIEGLNLEAVGVATDERGVIVDKFMRTSVQNIYAGGDVAGFNLADHAKAQGKIAAEIVAGLDSEGFDPKIIPVTFGVNPGEVASIGLQEREVHNPKVGVYKSMKMNAPGFFQGLVKVVADSSGEIVGVHTFGYNVIEQIETAQALLEWNPKMDTVKELCINFSFFATIVRACQNVGLDLPIPVPFIYGIEPYPKGLEGPVPDRQLK